MKGLESDFLFELMSITLTDNTLSTYKYKATASNLLA